MNLDARELTIEAASAGRDVPPAHYGPAPEPELRLIAERLHGGPLDWYKAYRGNLYAEDQEMIYAIRRVPPADIA